MILWTGPLLPLAALVWPLLLAATMALPGVRHHAVRLLPLAPLPGLWLALADSEGVTTSPGLLLGVALALEPGARLLLGMAAALWCLAGLAAQPMAGRPNAAIFAGFWCVTLAGNLGVFLAQDVATFYAAFAAVSLASWFLIVHDRTPEALRAGRVYIVIALAGEVAILLGLILGAEAAGSIAVAEVRAAIDGPAAALLLVGFGIKAGLVPLHVWLPLAHPAAPVPGSAVLSGAIVKAGLAGMTLLLPEEVLGPVVIGLGLTGAFGAALWGLTQANPKAILAYSTVSQMGLMMMLVAAGGTAREAVPYFAMHHGFAKGALFLLVGVMLVSPAGWQRWPCLIVAAIVAASVAGAPLTGGALAKAAVKQDLAEWAILALSLSSVTTALVLLWFLVRLRRLEASGDAHGWAARLAVPAILGMLALAMPWVLWQDWTGHAPGYPAKPGNLLDAIWPVGAALLIAPVLVRWPPPEVPPGDLLMVIAPRKRRRKRMPQPPSFRTGLPSVGAAFTAGRSGLQNAMIRWSRSGWLLLLLIPLIFALLA